MKNNLKKNVITVNNVRDCSSLGYCQGDLWQCCICYSEWCMVLVIWPLFTPCLYCIITARCRVIYLAMAPSTTQCYQLPITPLVAIINYVLRATHCLASAKSFPVQHWGFSRTPEYVIKIVWYLVVSGNLIMNNNNKSVLSSSPSRLFHQAECSLEPSVFITHWVRLCVGQEKLQKL